MNFIQKRYKYQLERIGSFPHNIKDEVILLILFLWVLSEFSDVLQDESNLPEAPLDLQILQHSYFIFQSSFPECKAKWLFSAPTNTQLL